MKIGLTYLNNLEEILNSLPGEYDRIRRFRSSLNPGIRDFFDKVFLVGFREGLLLNLDQTQHTEDSHAGDSLKGKFVRLAATTLIRAPECYGNFDEEYTMDSNCAFCPVKQQCMDGVKCEDK